MSGILKRYVENQRFGEDLLEEAILIVYNKVKSYDLVKENLYSYV